MTPHEPPVVGRTYRHRRKRDAPPVRVEAVASGEVTVVPQPYFRGDALVIPSGAPLVHTVEAFWRVWK
jgi:hypothetical protein